VVCTSQGLQHGVVELRQRRVGTGFGGAHPRTRTVGGQRPGNQRAQRPRVRGRLAEIRQQAGGADRTTQADVRVQLGSGHADACGGSGEPALGLAHIRAARQQRAAIADRDRLLHCRRVRAAVHAGRYLAGRLAEQRGQLVTGGLAARA